MFCPKCGTENPEKGRFCRSCGTDLSGVASAVSGELIKLHSDVSPPIDKDKAVTWESAITSIFTSVAFFAIAAVLGTTGIIGGRVWWFWMLIPAFTMLGKGLSHVYQLKKAEKLRLALNQQNPSQPILQKAEPLNLPNSTPDYVKPVGSIYDTDDLVVPTSVTENTTRQLQMNPEGETMTLPNVKEK